MVGAVLVRDGVVIGMGHHRRYGDLHAEREALADCRRRGNDPRGATAYVTLEPCCHHGKQPPCTDALIEAGITRVVYARPDPHADSGGGADVLRRAGISCELCRDSVLATRLSDPFVKRVTTGLPWVIAKWAQTAVGSLTTPEGESPWITNDFSLKRVHRLRARVDAIVTGVGTVLADDPLLTARGVRRVRRVAQRVVISGRRGLPDECKLAQAVGKGAEVVTVGGDGDRVDLTTTLGRLVERHDATSVMLECGPTLLGAFFSAELVDEAFVYVAPPETKGPHGAGREAVGGPPADWLRSLAFVRNKPLGGDIESWYRKIPARS
jgi:diaminohydroxyphosphoribosylaminopyrimidine deaminase/5-amino-6-(5-phosphoribosylamino)uracil reductase